MAEGNKKVLSEAECLARRKEGLDEFIWKLYSGQRISLEQTCYIAQVDREYAYRAVVSKITTRLIYKLRHADPSGLDALQSVKSRLEEEMSAMKEDDDRALMETRRQLVELREQLRNVGCECDDGRADEGEAADPAPVGSGKVRTNVFHGLITRIRAAFVRIVSNDWIPHILIVAGTLLIVGVCIVGVVSAATPDGERTAGGATVARYRVVTDELEDAMKRRDAMVDHLGELGEGIEYLMSCYAEGAQELSVQQARIAYLTSAVEDAVMAKEVF